MTDLELRREEAFQLYAMFAGDLERTAHALNVRAVDVLKMSEAEGWLDKLKPIIALKNSSRPGDLERGLSRAANFVQAHRMRLFVGRVLNRLTMMSPEELEEYLLTGTTTRGEKIKKLSTKALADLAMAMEKAQALTYLALSDTSADRAKRNETQDVDVAAMDIHAKIALAMSQVKDSSTPRALLFDAQLEEGQTIQAEAKVVRQEDAAPYNKDS